MQIEQVKQPPTLAKRLALLFAILVMLGLGGALMARMQEAQAEQARLAAARDAAAASASEAPEIDVVQPVAAQLVPMVVMTGSLEPGESADLSFSVAGRVARVDVALGAHVEEGQIIAALDRASIGAQSAQTDAAIAVAQAGVDVARDRVQLLTGLVASGAAPQRQLTDAQQALAVAEAQLIQAQTVRRSVATASADHTLRAPFDGVVTRVPSGVGAVAAPGLALAHIEDLSQLRLRTTVSQSELEALHVGDEVVLEGTGARGRITSVVRSLDAATRRAPVEVLVPNPEGVLVAHSLVRARVSVGAARPALRIPATSRRPNGTVLLVDADGRVVVREIQAMGDLDGSWLVSEGLTAEDRVVVRPAQAREGMIVVPRLAPQPSTVAATR